jgi:UDP-N-acetylglucosamine 2-epimerase (non-hydrolysing)
VGDKVVTFILGTTAEALKVLPIIQRLIPLGVKIKIVTLSQHTSKLNDLLKQGDPSIEIDQLNLGRKRDLDGSFTALLWFFRSAVTLSRAMRNWPQTFVMVHGDTLSTLIGVITSRLAGLQVVHVEAGLRTNKLFDPFPEEIIRRLTSKLASHHLAPSMEARMNLISEDVPVLSIQMTEGNTALDNLSGLRRSSNRTLAPMPMLIVTLHRHELLKNRRLLHETLTYVNLLSESFSVHLFLDTRLQGWIEKSKFDISLSIKRHEKISHDTFLKLLMDADLVITDSGGLQEELAFFGIPGIIHRRNTERQDGLGANLSLSLWKIENLKVFIGEYSKYQRPQMTLKTSPSEKSIQALKQWGLL